MLKPGALFQGTMLPTRNSNYGRGRTVAPDTFCPRPSRGTRAPAFLLRCGDPRCAIRRLRAAFFEAATAAQARFLALAHHRRTPAAIVAQRRHIRNTIGVYCCDYLGAVRGPRHTDMNPEMAYVIRPCSLPQNPAFSPCKGRETRANWALKLLTSRVFSATAGITERPKANFLPAVRVRRRRRG